MTDRIDIANCITVLLQAVDLQDWTAARACLADEVDTDYSSLFGGSPERLRSDALIKRWRDLVPGFDSTQHIAGPVLIYEVHGDSAKARTAVRAYHYFEEAPGGSVWIVAGRYEMQLSRRESEWRIAALGFVTICLPRQFRIHSKLLLTTTIISTYSRARGNTRPSCPAIQFRRTERLAQSIEPSRNTDADFPAYRR